MPYNTSEAAAMRMKRYLDDMKDGRDVIRWPTREPQKLAHRIREAIAAARHQAREKGKSVWIPYTELKYFYQLHAKDGFVEARWIGPEGGPKLEHAKIPKPETVKDVRDLQSIVGVILEMNQDAIEIHFPDAELTKDGLMTLHKWCGKNDWTLIDEHENGVTITQRKVDDILAWDPEETDMYVKEKGGEDVGK